MSSINTQFQQLLSSCKSRMASQDMEQKSERRQNTSVIVGERVSVGLKESSKVVFSLQDFLEKSHKTEVDPIQVNELSDSDIEEVESVHNEDVDNASDESVNGVLSNDEDTDSDIEQVKSDPPNSEKVWNRFSSENSDSDLDDDYEKLDDIMDSLNSKYKEESSPDILDDSIIIDNEKNISEELSYRKQFLNVKTKPTEPEIIPVRVPEDLPSKDILLGQKFAPTSNTSLFSNNKMEPSLQKREDLKRKYQEDSNQAKRFRGNSIKTSVMERVPSFDDDSSSDFAEDDDEDPAELVTSEWDICNHGDLVHDYMCYECTYNRWRVSWNAVQPKERRKERPEFLDISHRLNIGNFRNISIRRSTEKSPVKSAPSGKENQSSNFSRIPPSSGKPDFTLPSSFNASQSKSEEAKKPSFSFDKLPAGISISAYRPNTGKSNPSYSDESSKSPIKESAEPDPQDQTEDSTKEDSGDPVNLIKTVDWQAVFQFTGLKDADDTD